jgi:GT2 family glycosyltransferase
MTSSAQIAIAVVMRDRFSMFPRCLDAISAHTVSPFRVVLVLAGADRATASALREYDDLLAGNLTLVTHPSLLTQAEARNLALANITQRYCVVVENDTIVHPGWLLPLVECMREERAAVVAPLVLEFWNERIHAAGGDLEERETVTGRELRNRIGFQGRQRGSLPQNRFQIGYPENHCILIDRELLPDRALFDNVEPFDVDLGLTLRRRGLAVFLEARSLVTYVSPPPLRLEDLQAFKMRWDFPAWTARNRSFKTKWQVQYDRAGKELSYKRQQLRLGLARWWPNAFNLRMANACVSLLKRIRVRCNARMR